MTEIKPEPTEAELRRQEKEAREKALIEAYIRDTPRRERDERRRRSAQEIAKGIDFDVFNNDD